MKRLLSYAMVLIAALLLPADALGQGVGVFSRSDCTTITGPVTGKTYCFDTTKKALQVYTGTVWVTLAGTTATTGTGVGTNVAIGLTALDAVTTGYQMIAIGKDALNSATTAFTNIAIGTSALTALTATDGALLDAQNNIAIGDQAMILCTTCRSNTAIGAQTLSKAITGHRGNIAIGQFAMRLAVGNEATGEANFNVAVGMNALEYLTIGQNNVAVGALAMAYPTNQDYNSTGRDNAAFGVKAFQHAGAGKQNTALGAEAMAQMRLGDSNVAIGYRAMLGSLVAGVPQDTAGMIENVAVGALTGLGLTSGALNVMVGSEAGTGLTTGRQNTFVGYNAGKSAITGTDNVCLGFRACRDETGSNKLYIMNTASTTPLIGGDFDDAMVIVNGWQRQATAAVTLGAGATTLNILRSVVTVTGDGAGNTLSTITAGSNSRPAGGTGLTLLFVDALVTITDDATSTADTVNLSAAFTSTANDVLTLIHNGTKWLEKSRSVN